MLKRIRDFFGRPEIKILCLSVGLTLFVSSIISFGIYLFKGIFWTPFFITIGLQFIIFIILNSIQSSKDFVTYTKLQNEALDTMSKYTIQVQCAYCKQNNIAPIVLNKENKFACESCKQVNGIKMQFFTTQITTMIEKMEIHPLQDMVSKINNQDSQDI